MCTMVVGIYYYVVFCCFIFVTCQAHGVVRITDLRVPITAEHEALLDCRYDLDGLQLYDVKWYKDDQQFFRCLPGGEVHEYPIEGVKIYYSKFVAIGSCPVKLTALSAKSSGEYKCEVVSERPAFITDTKSAKLRVGVFGKKHKLKEFVPMHSTELPQQKELNTTYHAYSSKGYILSWSNITFYFLLFIIYTNCITTL